MKIGLLTYHHSMNYGAVLQTYATCRALKELGHEVEIIDFRHPEKSSNWSFPFYFKVKAFDSFKKKYYAPCTNYIASFEELRARKYDYECLIVGSDQTWNPNISKGNHLAYFLTFGDDTCRRLSYASSFGVSEWPSELEEEVPIIKNALKRFKRISVREETGRELLKKTFGLDSTVVLDPTLLHDDYSELIGEVMQTDNIICCLLHRYPKQMEVIRAFNSFMGKKGKVISTIRPVRGLSYMYPPSLEKWLKSIASAGFVITDSFHGVAFSLIFRREFVVITPDIGKNSRLKDLMNILGLSNRYFLENDNFDFSSIVNKKIDYSKVEKALELERNKSWDFLKNNLI